MTDLLELYHEVIVDHGKHPRNFGELQDAVKLQGINPLCGDQLTLYLSIKQGVIVDVRFLGQGCAISMASSSLMTQAIKGKTVMEAKAIFEAFHQLLLKEKEVEELKSVLGKLIVLQGVVAYPSRIKCASLAWHTLNALLAGEDHPISTEKEND